MNIESAGVVSTASPYESHSHSSATIPSGTGKAQNQPRSCPGHLRVGAFFVPNGHQDSTGNWADGDATGCRDATGLPMPHSAASSHRARLYPNALNCDTANLGVVWAISMVVIPSLAPPSLELLSWTYFCWKIITISSLNPHHLTLILSKSQDCSFLLKTVDLS
jgi:hypothetical protein